MLWLPFFHHGNMFGWHSSENLLQPSWPFALYACTCFCSKYLNYKYPITDLFHFSALFQRFSNVSFMIKSLISSSRPSLTFNSGFFNTDQLFTSWSFFLTYCITHFPIILSLTLSILNLVKPLIKCHIIFFFAKYANLALMASYTWLLFQNYLHTRSHCVAINNSTSPVPVLFWCPSGKHSRPTSVPHIYQQSSMSISFVQPSLACRWHQMLETY